jgi:uncharacterized protein YqeY
MSLADRINADLAPAMKAKDVVRLEALRAAKTALMNKEIADGKPLAEGDAAKVLEMLIKQRREAVELFRKGAREELAAKDEAQIAVLEAYLPKAMSRDELASIVDAAIADTASKEPKHQGIVMKAVMAKLAGKRVDGKEVSAIVAEKLKPKP